MKGLFIPGITAEMFRNGCLESVEALMAEGEIYDINYSPWVSVAEKKPEETGEYLTTIKWYNGKNGYNYAVVKRDYYADVETWNDSLVIAWIPFPQPYKAESEEIKDE